MKILTFLILVYMVAAQTANCGPVAWAACQTACNLGYVTCCAGLGYVAGTFTAGAGIPAAVAGCSTAQGACMAGCTGLLLAPTP